MTDDPTEMLARIEWRYLDEPITDADVDAELVAHAQGRQGLHQRTSEET